jgi:hypothetical protein
MTECGWGFFSFVTWAMLVAYEHSVGIALETMESVGDAGTSALTAGIGGIGLLYTVDRIGLWQAIRFIHCGAGGAWES